MSDPSGAWINYNGEFHRAGSPVLTAANRGFRYGDGLFETMLVQDGRIRLGDYHFTRLLEGMDLLHFRRDLTRQSLSTQVLDLCARNHHSVLARVRLTVFRGEGQLFDTDDQPRYVIESAAPDPGHIPFNREGLRIGVFPDGRKACDRLANLKSGNFLLYAQAARYARDQGWDDGLVLNGHDRLADSCMANLFYIRAGKVYTPPLSEGCVAGVMRRFLLERMPGWGFAVAERPIGVKDLADADEIILTNAVRTVRWVGALGEWAGRGPLARELYELAVKAV